MIVVRFFTAICLCFCFCFLFTAKAHAESPEVKELFKKLAELNAQIPASYASMLKAANEYASVKAKEKEIEAAGEDRRGTRWDSAGISGGFGSSSTESSGSGPTAIENQSTSVSASISIALSSWFVNNALELTEELQRNALIALKIQLALETGASHFDYQRASTQYSTVAFLSLGLERLKYCSSQGFIPLSRENLALLDIQLANNQFKLEAIDAQVAVARSNLKRLTDTDYPNIVAQMEKILEELRKRYLSEPCEDNDTNIEANWTGIDWKEIEKNFPIDANVETAIATAKTSPALVMADLGTNLARNQWYLAMAGMAPVLTFSFDRSHSETSLGGSTIATDTDSFRVSLGFHITAGIPYHLRAKRLLEESARLNYRATMLQVRNSLENSYSNLRSTKANIRLMENSILTNTFPALKQLAKIDDSNFKTVLSLIEAAFAQIDVVFNGVSGYHMQRAGILAQTGTLLDVLQKKIDETPRP